VTRGNGEIGEVITNNAKAFKNLPLHIPYQGELILRGEAVIGYSDFKKINIEIEEIDAKYKNPRNLCSGSVRQLNNEITAKRNVKFYAFALVQASGTDFNNSRNQQLNWLSKQGFAVVEHYEVSEDSLEERMDYFETHIIDNDLPSDGLVFVYDDIAYGESLGNTAKFPRDSFAFKWADEQKKTNLLEVEWSPSRTGLINPVAIFEPVELEGTTVSRASVHNISIMEELELGVGDCIEVYKANMIIPQIAENHTRSGVRDIPNICPVCGGATEVKQIANAKALYCVNPKCQVKQLKSFALFVSRNALNIEGLSEATLEKLIGKGFIKTYSDIFYLKQHMEEIQKMEGFGEKSYLNLQASIEKARKTTLPKVIYGLGIANIGLANAKMICKDFDYDINRMISASVEELNMIDGVGDVIAQTFVDYFLKESNVLELKKILQELEIPKEINVAEQIFNGVNFVITGSVELYANRNDLKETIETRGGKVTGSVTSKTNYLINNDRSSSSSKNKKARELEIPIISETEFIALLGGE
ncbi:MAG: NAD-dependent DNA ligase LigA, partial [Lachnospiraceae bacterium]